MVSAEPCGLILAGGEGKRLRPLTERMAGDSRPKQFCPVLGPETLLEQTRRRVALVVSQGRTVVVLNEAHERFFAPLLAEVAASGVVFEPENLGTGPAILHGLLRLAALTPLSPVAIFPSDHYVSDDRIFMTHVTAALEVVRTRPDLVVLLGIAPDAADPGYGWIEPAGPIPGGRLLRVCRFWEKPSAALAQALWTAGCLWNSFVIIGGGPALLTLIRMAAPALHDAFSLIRPSFGTPMEAEAVRQLYARMSPVDFSRQVLARRPLNLAVLPVNGVDWSDLGEPRRVLATLSRVGIRPEWAEPVLATTA